jgi:hypothetical protein
MNRIYNLDRHLPYSETPSKPLSHPPRTDRLCVSFGEDYQDRQNMTQTTCLIKKKVRCSSIQTVNVRIQKAPITALVEHGRTSASTPFCTFVRARFLCMGIVPFS